MDGTQQLGTALIVESDAAAAFAARRRFEHAGFAVRTAASEGEALRRLGEGAPDVVVTGIPESAELCARIREAAALTDVPILVQSEAATTSNTLMLFALGADDVVSKTCDPLEVVARVNSILRRRTEHQASRRIGPLRIALGTGDAWIGPQALDLTMGERSALVQLARAYPGITTRESLDRAPWRSGEPGSNVTEVLVARLRRKINAAGGGVEIRAVRRSGYVLRPAAAETATS